MKALVVIVVGFLAAACTAGSFDSVPTIDQATAADLQARAIMRGCDEVICAGAPIYVLDSTSDQTRVALGRFTDEIRYLSPKEVEAATSSEGRLADGATLFEAESVHDAGTPEVVGVDVWITKGFQDSVRRTYLFVWDGTKWANSTPEGSGVTVTTSVT